MEIEQVLHMVGGTGENSYASNSKAQERGVLRAKPVMEEAIREICNTFLLEKLVAVDLGCSTGPNTLKVVSVIINTVNEHCRRSGYQLPEIQLFLNDLQSNDFNNIFQSLKRYEKQVREEKGEDFVSFYVVGLPGSFYKRLFPSRSVHLFHSSHSQMWLSQVPRGLDGEGAELNKGNICIGKTSSSVARRLYFEQFNEDFSAFLKHRSKELIHGGIMVLTIVGRRDYPNRADLYNMWELLAEALYSMASESILEEAKVNAFNMPYYTPSMDEIRSIIDKEGSFRLKQAQQFETGWEAVDDSTDNFTAGSSAGQFAAKYMRAAVEPLFVCHFGEEILDDLFSRYAENVARHLTEEKVKFLSFILVLKLKE